LKFQSAEIPQPDNYPRKTPVSYVNAEPAKRTTNVNIQQVSYPTYNPEPNNVFAPDDYNYY